MRRRVRKWAIRITASLFIGLFALVLTVELMIGYGARKNCRLAQNLFPGDRVSALIAHVECDSCNMADRNSAVWTLGMLSDRRALPVIEKYYTGKPCDHLRGICQYELEKALKLVRRGNSLEKALWRWMLPPETP